MKEFSQGDTVPVCVPISSIGEITGPCVGMEKGRMKAEGRKREWGEHPKKASLGKDSEVGTNGHVLLAAVPLTSPRGLPCPSSARSHLVGPARLLQELKPLLN